jgi:hypothetical protein
LFGRGDRAHGCQQGRARAGYLGLLPIRSFPDAAESLELTQGMNTVARHAAAGTVLVVERMGTHICVKH